MMKKLLLCFLCLLVYSSIPAQNDSIPDVPKYRKGLKYEVVTTQGKHIGFLIRETAETVIIEDRKQDRIYEIRKSTIVSIKPVSDSRVFKQDILGENAHAHTYLFGGSSYMSGEPTSYVNYQWFLFENINYGVTENVDITVNTLLLYPVSLGVKTKFRLNDKTFVGANTFFAANLSDQLNSAFFIGYGALARVTHGTSNENFSFSAGILGLNSGFIQSGNSNAIINLPYINFAYANRFHEHWAVTGEGWYFPEIEIGLAGVGFKFIRNRSSSWTFGCFTNINTVNNQIIPDLRSVPIPYIGLSSNLFMN